MDQTVTVDYSRLPQPYFGVHSGWRELYDVAWRLAARNIRQYQGRRYMDCAWNPDYNYQWVWDTSFMTFYCRYAPDQYPGIESLDTFYRNQREDGYIGMTYDVFTGEEPWPGFINPPLFAWAEWDYYQLTGDAGRLPRVIPHIERLMGWIDANLRNRPHRRRRGQGHGVFGEMGPDYYQLYYFPDCGSSGLDDSPRTPRIGEAGQYFDWIDLSSQMALSFRYLARLHRVLNQNTEANQWQERFEELAATINEELWCERTRFYHDRTLPENFVGAKTIAGFWPLLAGIASDSQVEALVEHLFDPREFYRPTPIPSLSADDPNYTEEGVYWRGGVWAPTNYMVLRGLRENGRGEEAHLLAVKYVDALEQTYRHQEPHTLWECNAPEKNEPGLAAYSLHRVKPDFVGWSGLGPLAILIEDVLGVELNMPSRTLTWSIRLVEEHGIQQLRLGEEGWLSLHCAVRAGAEDVAVVKLRSDAPLHAVLRCSHRTQAIDLPAGAEIQLTI